MTTSWAGNDQKVAAAIARAQGRAARAPGPDNYTPPTGDTWRLVRVTPGEMTCCACGETFASGEHCTRCGARDGETGPFRPPPPAVSTISYLQEDEYYVSRY